MNRNANGKTANARFPAVYNVASVTEVGLMSKTAYDTRLLVERYLEIRDQKETVQNNFPATLAEDMYAAMDAGELEPNQVRGAEGMVRYLSGDLASDTALNLALRHTLELDHPADIGASMVVETENVKANPERNTTGQSYTIDYETLDNVTLEGTLFGSGFPGGIAETGVTYNASNFTHVSVLTGSGDYVFKEGNFIVTSIYDSDGNAVNSMPYSGPEYATYDSTDYIQSLDDISDARSQIEGDEDSSDDWSISWPKVPNGSALAKGLVGVATIGLIGFVGAVLVIGRT